MEGRVKFIDAKSGQWGYVVPSDGSGDVYFKLLEVEESTRSKLDVGALVEFDLAEEGERRRAAGMRFLAGASGPDTAGLSRPLDARRPNPRGIFFDSALLPDPNYDYVCWLDVMGTGNQMLRSLPIAANFIFKLQCAVLEAAEEVEVDRAGLRLYPVMDGVYITSPRRFLLQKLLNQAMCRLAITFLNEPKPFHQFLVRGAIAFGPVYHGYALDPRSSIVMSRHELIRDSMLMGLPMAQAYRDEREAPPFGIAVHSSARAFSPEEDKPFRFIWLDWFNYAEPRIDPKELMIQLQKYFDWQLAHSTVTGYAEDRIRHHLKLAREFFTLADSATAATVGGR
ncbi:MAG: cold shock domain-containing protein [Acidobacteria bacterium]|nr:cold shock domain-containing protein [Acidobacteriota bacterium]